MKIREIWTKKYIEWLVRTRQIVLWRFRNNWTNRWVRISARFPAFSHGLQFAQEASIDFLSKSTIYPFIFGLVVMNAVCWPWSCEFKSQPILKSNVFFIVLVIKLVQDKEDAWAAQNDLLLELALPAELTDTWLAHAMWTHPQHCNGVSEL